MLVKWLKIRETNVIKLERLSKRPRDKIFLTGRLNTQSPITSSPPSKRLQFIYFLKLW